MIEFKVTTTNPVTGDATVDYELFTSVESAEQFNDLHPNSEVDFDSAIDWGHSEEKYEHFA